jgi:hypothetical protein
MMPFWWTVTALIAIWVSGYVCYRAGVTDGRKRLLKEQLRRREQDRRAFGAPRPAPRPGTHPATVKDVRYR